MKSLFSVDFRCLFPFPVTKDSSGNRLKEDIKDPQGILTKTVSFQYDVLGRVYQVNNPDGNYSEYGYAAIGGRISYQDPNGNPPTNFSYDALNRLVETIQPGGIDTLYDYDSQGNLVSVTDGNGNATSYIFDDMGRVYQEVSPDRGTTTYQHDPGGNVVSKTDARSITILYSYDALNRLTFKDFPTDTDIVYTYDTCTNGKGRLCQVVDQAGTTSYTYSLKGELVQENELILGINYVTGYQYDVNGNLEVLTYPSGRTVTHVHDNAEQVTSVLTTPPGGAQQTVASSISYMPFGPLASMTYGNGLARTLGYDLQYRVTSLQTGTLQDLTYVPDPNGNVQNIVDNLDSNKNKGYSYDSTNRIDGATGPWGSLSWTYDDVGNRLTYTDGSGTTNYNYFTGTNRLQALTGATNKTFSYTNAGNTEFEDTRQYVYDENNRLAQINDGGVIGDYTFNGYGERAIKTVQGTTTIFHYDQNGTLLGESDGVNFEDYIYLGRTPIARASGQDHYFIHTDHLDTPRVMTNSGGTSVWNLEARPFGDSETVTGAATLNLRLPGQYYDDESGMNYNYFRTYRPELGRYMEVDLVGLAGGTPNLYEYAFNNPVNWIDRLGLSGQKKDCPCADTAEDAAKQWFQKKYRTGNSYWKQSMMDNKEWCSNICQGSDGCHTWTPPQIGTSNYCRSLPCPAGTTKTGNVHTHPKPPPGVNPDKGSEFSNTDKWGSKDSNAPYFMGDHKGNIHGYHYHEGGEMGVVGRVR